MTDYSGWTDEQVNEAIFKAKGWRKGVYVFGNLLDSWARKLDDGWIDVKNEIPDYTHSWELCGELLEEFERGGIAKVQSLTLGWLWMAYTGTEEKPISCTATAPQRAICEAWLAWKEQG